MKALALAIALLAAGSAPAFSQTVLVNWNFENSTAGAGGAAGVFNTSGASEIYNATSKTLTSASAGVFASTATLDFNNLVGAMGGAANNNWGSFGGVAPGTTTPVTGGALSIIGSGNNLHYVDFTFSTLGYNTIHVSYDTRGTATGFSSNIWSDVTAGAGHTFTTTIGGRNVTTFSNQGFDITGIDNLTSVTLRLAVDGSTSTSGNNRFDNVVVTGLTIVPEPGTYAALISVSSLGFALWRRRRATSLSVA